MNSPKPRLRIAPTGEGPRFGERTEETIDWFRRQIITLSRRNDSLLNDLIFYRTVCHWLTGGIICAVFAAALLYLYNTLGILP
jgi:hypothetical protein